MTLLLLMAWTASASAACELPKALVTPSPSQINSPGPDGFEPWLASLKAWRVSCRKELAYNDSVYDVPSLRWARTAYIQPQMHPYDRYFYEPAAGYTVDRWLADLDERYGGIDSALVWPTYTNIGLDDRNQFDLIRAMPGGVPAIRAFVDRLHAKGVKVLWPYNPWDTGTRRSEGDEELVAPRVRGGASRAEPVTISGPSYVGRNGRGGPGPRSRLCTRPEPRGVLLRFFEKMSVFPGQLALATAQEEVTERSPRMRSSSFRN